MKRPEGELLPDKVYERHYGNNYQLYKHKEPEELKDCTQQSIIVEVELVIHKPENQYPYT